ncbi:MAG: hypothetical protein HKO53_06995 [Gemmatimonadetes bacterium]|nr:hypothetical protein [Gemmatimonadota bacterium]
MIEVVVGSPETMGAEAILRPVSDALEPVSTVSRDIGIAAGQEVLDRLGALGELPPGGALVTPAGHLRCDFLVHVSVMGRGEPVDADTVERAFLNGLRRAGAMGLSSLAAPPLGCGAQGLDAERSAAAMRRAVETHRMASPLPDRVVIAVASEYELDVFRRAFSEGPEPGAHGGRGQNCSAPGTRPTPAEPTTT